MSIVDIRPALRAFLLDDASVYAAVEGNLTREQGGSRIFPVKIPQGETKPSLVLTRISGQGDHHMQGPSGLARTRYQIVAWALTADLAVALADLAKDRLDGYAGPMSWTASAVATTVRVQGVFFDSERDEYDDVAKLFGMSRDYFVNYEER